MSQVMPMNYHTPPCNQKNWKEFGSSCLFAFYKAKEGNSKLTLSINW